MRRVNARPWLGEASVVVVAAGRQDIILSSRALVPGKDLPCAHAPGFPDVDAKHLRAFANKFQQTSQEDIPHRQSYKNSHPRSASRSMLHILGRCYAPGVKIHYLFAVFGATGLATVRKSKWHYAPTRASGRADQPPRLLGFQRPHGRL